MSRYYVALPPGHYSRPKDFPAYDWRTTARRIDASDAQAAADAFVASYGGTPGNLQEVAPWQGAQVFEYNGKAYALVLVAPCEVNP